MIELNDLVIFLFYGVCKVHSRDKIFDPISSFVVSLFQRYHVSYVPFLRILGNHIWCHIDKSTFRVVIGRVSTHTYFWVFMY